MISDVRKLGQWRSTGAVARGRAYAGMLFADPQIPITILFSLNVFLLNANAVITVRLPPEILSRRLSVTFGFDVSLHIIGPDVSIIRYRLLVISSFVSLEAHCTAVPCDTASAPLPVNEMNAPQQTTQEPVLHLSATRSATIISKDFYRRRRAAMPVRGRLCLWAASSRQCAVTRRAGERLEPEKRESVHNLRGAASV